jgi:hypothetical protein
LQKISNNPDRITTCFSIITNTVDDGNNASKGNGSSTSANVPSRRGSSNELIHNKIYDFECESMYVKSEWIKYIKILMKASQ